MQAPSRLFGLNKTQKQSSNDSTQTKGLPSLPNDVIRAMMMFLDTPSICKLCRSGKSFVWLNRDARLWETLVQKDILRAYRPKDISQHTKQYYIRFKQKDYPRKSFEFPAISQAMNVVWPCPLSGRVVTLDVKSPTLRIWSTAEKMARVCELPKDEVVVYCAENRDESILIYTERGRYTWSEREDKPIIKQVFKRSVHAMLWSLNQTCSVTVFKDHLDRLEYQSPQGSHTYNLPARIQNCCLGIDETACIVGCENQQALHWTSPSQTPHVLQHHQNLTWATVGPRERAYTLTQNTFTIWSKGTPIFTTPAPSLVRLERCMPDGTPVAINRGDVPVQLDLDLDWKHKSCTTIPLKRDKYQYSRALPCIDGSMILLQTANAGGQLQYRVILHNVPDVETLVKQSTTIFLKK